MVVKVKEPLPDEWPHMRAGQTVFTYFHFAADEALTRAVMKSGITAVAYETIKDAKGGLPLLTPMSEVAGRMSIQEGAKYLERPFDGRGILLGRRAGGGPGDGGRCSAAGWSGRTPPGWPPGWGRTCSSSTSTSTGCATSTT